MNKEKGLLIVIEGVDGVEKPLLFAQPLLS